MPNKIVSSLSLEALHALLTEIEQQHGRTPELKDIQAVAAARGITVSLMGASTFRRTTWEEHIGKIERARELANQVAALKATGAGTTLADAANVLIGQEVFNLAQGVNDAEGLEILSRITTRLTRLQHFATKLESDLSLRDEQIGKLQREKSAWEEQRAKVAALTEQVRNAPAATADEIRAKVVAELDRVMGITK